MPYKLHKLDPEKEHLLEAGLLLPVMEEFYTIQGEGFHTGKPAHFIRIGGCDVGCHWCDVKESWDANLHPLTPVVELSAKVKDSGARSVVVTGGEPLMYNLKALCEKLHELSFDLYLETSGAYPLSGKWDWICLSPKKNMKPLPEIYAKAHELKVIVHNQHDLKWAEEQAAKVSPSCYLFLQAEWSKREALTPVLVEYVKAHPKWMLRLQSHKYMHIP